MIILFWKDHTQPWIVCQTHQNIHSNLLNHSCSITRFLAFDLLGPVWDSHPDPDTWGTEPSYIFIFLEKNITEHNMIGQSNDILLLVYKRPFLEKNVIHFPKALQIRALCVWCCFLSCCCNSTRKVKLSNKGGQIIPPLSNDREKESLMRHQGFSELRSDSRGFL